jgi:hypothetical protein
MVRTGAVVKHIATRLFPGATAALVFGSIVGCRSAPEPIAFENRVFYQYDDFSVRRNAKDFEDDYPPLNLAEKRPNPEYLGKTILGGTVHISRPKNWVIRGATNKPENRFIQYVSPNEYMVSIYERVDSPEDLWRDIMNRYEDDAKKNGAEIIGSRVPISTWNAQGRAYVVKRRVKAAKQPFVNMSREFLARSEHRVILVQIVHQGDSPAPVSEELLRVIQTLEVL